MHAGAGYQGWGTGSWGLHNGDLGTGGHMLGLGALRLCSGAGSNTLGSWDQVPNVTCQDCGTMTRGLESCAPKLGAWDLSATCWNGGTVGQGPHAVHWDWEFGGSAAGPNLAMVMPGPHGSARSNSAIVQLGAI